MKTKRIILIGKEERELIRSWFVEEILMRGDVRNFDRLIETSLTHQHNFVVVEGEMIDEYQKLGYELRKPNNNELILWGAYNIAKGAWKYSDVSYHTLKRMESNIMILA